MKPAAQTVGLLAFALCTLVYPAARGQQPAPSAEFIPTGAEGLRASEADGRHAIDTEKSLLKVRVYRSGLFSVFAHNHEIAAPIAEGVVQTTGTAAVELRADARKLRVLDPDLAPEKRAEVQKTMEGPEVLDSSRFPEIVFRSTSVEKSGAANWTARGNLSLHGQMSPVVVDVTEKEGRYTGSVVLKQRDFGITPVRIAGGAVSVKNEVRIEFEIVVVGKALAARPEVADAAELRRRSAPGRTAE